MTKIIRTNGESKKAKHELSYVVDGIFVSLFVAIAICDINIWSVCAEETCKEPNTLASAISILLPVVFSIVSIALTVRQEKIYGLTITEFNRIRGKSYFTFFHKLLVFVGLVICLCICEGFRLTISSYVLTAISVFYGLYFGYEEIQVLILNKRYIKRVLRNAYGRLKPDPLMKHDESDEYYVNKAFRVMIFKEGIESAVDVLDKRGKKPRTDENGDHLLYLLEIQNDALWDIRDRLELYEKNPALPRDDGLLVPDIIDKGFENVESLLKSEKEENIKALSDTSDDKPIHQMTWTLLHLVFIGEKLKLSDRCNRKLNSLASASVVAAVNTKLKDINYFFDIKMSLETLKDGKLWFVRALRDGPLFPSQIFSRDKCNIGLFVSVAIYNAFINNHLAIEGDDSIYKFLREPTKGRNAFGDSWNSLLEETLGTIDKVDLIDILLGQYHLVPEKHYKFLYWASGARHIIDEKEFTITYLFKLWFNWILYSLRPIGVNPTKLLNKLNKLKGEHWPTMEKVLTEIVLEFDSEQGAFAPNRYKDDKEFFALFNLSPAKVPDNKALDAFRTFINDERKAMMDKEPVYSEDHLAKWKEKLCASFDKAMNFKDAKLDIIEKPDASIIKKDSRVINLSSGVDEEVLSHLESQEIIYEANEIVREKISEIVEPMRNELKGRGFSDETFKEVDISEYQYINSDYLDVHELNEENAAIADKLNKTYEPYLPAKIFLKDGFVSIYFKSNESESAVRHLSKEEIDDIIDCEYKPVNGRFIYNEISNTNNRSVILTKSKLFERIKKVYIRVEIHYEYYVEVHDGKYFAYKFTGNESD